MRITVLVGVLTVYLACPSVIQPGLCGRLLAEMEPCVAGKNYTDGCNYCLCAPDGSMACTLMFCDPVWMTMGFRTWEGDPWAMNYQVRCFLKHVEDTSMNLAECLLYKDKQE